MTIIGTNHFVSLEAAQKYYEPYGEDAEGVQRKLDAGEIAIGRPGLRAGQRATVIAGEGRYQIEPMPLTRAQKEALEFAEHIKALGFRVYLAAAGDYGFITDETGSRVLDFSFSCGGSLGGNYGPPSTQSGTGWRMDETPEQLRTKQDVEKALYATPPAFAGKGWRYFTTAAQQLARYGSSSRYEQL